MAILKNKIQGDSLSIGFYFNPEYDISRIEHHYVYMNDVLVVSSVVGSVIRVELTSEDTKNYIGSVKLTLVIDDNIFGIRKTNVGNIYFAQSDTISDASINEGYDLVISLIVDETITSATIKLLEAFQGLSAYDIYVKYTTDVPVKTEEEWNDAVNAAKTAAELAETKAETAQEFAETAAETATLKASEALVSANNAAESEGNALVSENNAHASEENAATSEENAGTSETNALSYKNAANQSAIDSDAAKDLSISAKNDSITAKDISVQAKLDSITAKDTSVTKAGEASTSATNAHNSELNAAASALLAATAIGSIAYNAAAPTPAANKRYRFTSAGLCTIFTAGSQQVLVDDELQVTYTAPSIYVYTFVPVASLDEKAANKSTNLETDKASDVKFPSAKAVYTPLTNNEKALAEVLNLLYAKITALEDFIKNSVFENLQVDTLTSVKDIKYQGAPMFILGTTAPSITPDFIGQVYIKTSATVAAYTATGTTNSGDWKQTA